jgi:4-amino-4-deoxy-L-arabinose transferase-like glycosyltransferase
MNPAPVDAALAKGGPDSARGALAPAFISQLRAEPRVQTLLVLLLSAALVPRLILLPVNENFYGDAVIRTELAARWAAHPHWITSWADGAFQFGPLHIYLMGLLLRVWPSQEHVGRLLSLFFGVFSIIPLFWLTRRLMGQRAAVWACLAFSAWGIHLQFSTTAASEAVALFFVLGSLAFFAAAMEEGRFAPLVCSALALNLACATRYDAWLLIPLLTVALLFGDKDRVAAITRAAFFALFCLPFPLFWMDGNERVPPDHDPFAPIRFIEQFHRAWVSDGLGRWGQIGYRLQNLFFWPGAALATLSPLVAFFGMFGMARAFRQRPEQRWLLYVAWIPTLYFTFRSTVLLTFQPLARFTATELALLLPYVYFGFLELLKKAGVWTRRAAAALAIAVAIAEPIALGAFTLRSDGRLEQALRPISPTSTNPEAIMRVARFIKEEIAPRNGAIILDSDPAYSDLQVAFFGGLPEERMARYRWDDCQGDGGCFPDRLRTANPEYLIRIEGGKLAENPDFELLDNRVRLGDRWFEELPGFPLPYHVYRRR